jgi:hypothetical protein
VQLRGVKAKQRTNLLVPVFFSLLLQLVDRTPHVPSGDADALPPMHEHPYFSSSRRNVRELVERWTRIFQEDYDSYPAHLQHLRSPVPPDTPLDSALLQCVLDRSYLLRQSAATQQALKKRLWHVGSILKTMHNTLWPCNEYFEALAAVLRASFSHLRHLDTELMCAETDVPCVCDGESEKRVYDEADDMPLKPAVAEPWCDARLEDRTMMMMLLPPLEGECGGLSSDSSDAEEAEEAGGLGGDSGEDESAGEARKSTPGAAAIAVAPVEGAEKGQQEVAQEPSRADGGGPAGRAGGATGVEEAHASEASDGSVLTADEAALLQQECGQMACAVVEVEVARPPRGSSARKKAQKARAKARKQTEADAAAVAADGGAGAGTEDTAQELKQGS